MDVTGHYGIKKPGENDYADVAVLNENADAIDAALHDLETGKAGLDPETGKVKAEQMPPMDYVPTGRKVNGKALSGDIALTAEDVGAVAEHAGYVHLNGRLIQGARGIEGPDGGSLSLMGYNSIDMGLHWGDVLTFAGGGTNTRTATFATSKVTGIPTPTDPADAANKAYVDGKMLVFTEKTVAVSAWKSSSYGSIGYPWEAWISCPGADGNKIPLVMFLPADAVSGNFAPFAYSSDKEYGEGVYIYCKTRPTATVTISSIVCIKGV